MKIKTQCDLKAGSIAEEHKNKSALLKDKAEVRDYCAACTGTLQVLTTVPQTEQSLLETRNKHAELVAACDSTIKEHEQKVESVRKLEDLIQTLSTGMAAKEGQENGYQTQLQGRFCDFANDCAPVDPNLCLVGRREQSY